MKALLWGICIALAAAAAPSVHAQQTTPPGETTGPVLAEVVVTGTRRTDRTVTDSASPIDVISSSELRSQPAANMLDEVKYVVPSFFVSQNTSLMPPASSARHRCAVYPPMRFWSC